SSPGTALHFLHFSSSPLSSRPARLPSLASPAQAPPSPSRPETPLCACLPGCRGQRSTVDRERAGQGKFLDGGCDGSPCVPPGGAGGSCGSCGLGGPCPRHQPLVEISR